LLKQFNQTINLKKEKKTKKQALHKTKNGKLFHGWKYDMLMPFFKFAVFMHFC